jgi:polar amino acid transport system substrate-binding protein
MKNKTLIILLAFSLVILGCKKENSELKVGTDASFPPFEFFEGGEKLVGFDIDLLDEIAKRAGYKLKYEDMKFGGLIPALTSGNLDVLISTITITEERKQNVAFTDPYYKAGALIAVSANNEDINSLDDLAGKRVGVKIGTTHSNLAKSIAGAIVTDFDDTEEILLSLTTDKIDAIINDAPMLQYWVATKAKGQAKVVGELINAEDWGIVLRKEDAKIVEKFNKALAEIRKDGTYNKIYDKWFGSDIETTDEVSIENETINE